MSTVDPRPLAKPMEFARVGSRLYGIDREGRVHVFREGEPGPRHRHVASPAVRRAWLSFLGQLILSEHRRRATEERRGAHRA